MSDFDEDWIFVDSFGLGSISQLNDVAADVSHKQQLGFPIPQGDEVTAYRERMKAGEYDAAKKPAEKPANGRRKRSTIKREAKKRA
jgi:hypothetical protein